MAVLTTMDKMKKEKKLIIFEMARKNNKERRATWTRLLELESRDVSLALSNWELKKILRNCLESSLTTCDSALLFEILYRINPVLNKGNLILVYSSRNFLYQLFWERIYLELWEELDRQLQKQKAA